ncbi:MAG: hypothetical protein ACR2G0_11755 [Chthoniobacterales bacterium]
MRKRNSGEEGSILIAVMIIMILLAAGLATHLSSLVNVERLQNQRVANDRAIMAAEAGLAQAIAQLQGMGSLPTANQTWTMNVPAAQFAPFQAVVVNVYPRPIGGHPTSWTLASTATSASDARTRPFSRRVQTTLFQENFAKYEYFVNDFGGVWTPGYFHFEGFGSVFLGPYHTNSGVGFWPNLWFVNDATTAAPKGVRYFSDYNTYQGIYGKSDASDYANIMQYYSSTFDNAPQFYHGLNVLSDPISMPADMTSTAEPRTAELRDNAGLELPRDYKGYDATKGANFAIEMDAAGGKSNDGKVYVKQYLGLKSDGKPYYGPKRTYKVKDINSAMIVYGNIKSLQGTLDGKLTIGAFRKQPDAKDPDPSDPGGAVDITGSLNYASRPDDLSYTDAPGLYTADGKGINQDYVATLLDQMDKVTDILGIVSEGDVMIKEKDLDGQLVAADVNNPIHLDAIVMATGSATSATTDGGYGVENFKTRAKGAALAIGGEIQNYGYSWALYSGNNMTNGLVKTRLWDQRAYKPGGAPPFFPTTGNLQPIPQSWRSNYVTNAAVIPWFPQ